MGALNFITTVLDLRAKGMTMMRMPLTVWAWFVTAILGLLAFGVLLSAGILLLMDRNLGTSFFVPIGTINGLLTGHKGGSPLLWQHLFWFFGHPEVYIAILPAMGMARSCFPLLAQADLGYKAMVYAILAIGFRLSWLGPSHVHERYEPHRVCILHHDHGHRRSLGHQDI